MVNSVQQAGRGGAGGAQNNNYGPKFGTLFENCQAPCELTGCIENQSGKSGANATRRVLRLECELGALLSHDDAWTAVKRGVPAKLDAVLQLFVDNNIINCDQKQAFRDYFAKSGVRALVAYEGGMLDALVKMGYTGLDAGAREAREVMMRYQRNQIVAGVANDWKDY